MASKSGYINNNEDDDTIIDDQKSSNLVSISEQEVNINFMRDEDHATIYTSDTTYMTKLDKLCGTNPDMHSLIADTDRGKTYRVEDKTLISSAQRKENYLRNRKLLLING